MRAVKKRAIRRFIIPCVCGGILLSSTCLTPFKGIFAELFNVGHAHAALNEKDDETSVGLFPSDTIIDTQDVSNEPDTPNADRVEIVADEFIYNDQEQIIIAKGNVEIVQGSEILTADLVRYNLKTDSAEAIGNVALLQENGDIHFAERLEFQQKLKEGLVEGLYSYLVDGARLTANEGQQIEGGNRVIMRNATYTPCVPCQKSDDISIRDQLMTEDEPAWAIEADEVIHDKANQQVKYKNAKFDFYGVPVFYTPYFAHPDGSVKQKSGFLTPSFGFDSELGANITSRYYWAIDKDKDATFGVMLPTNEPPLFLGEYRQRFESGYIEFAFSGTSSDRLDTENDVEIQRDSEFRGHLFGEGLWDINDEWRAGFQIENSTDDQFLREYNITSEDVLETEFYAERFDNRDYFVVRGYGFQDRRIVANDVDQPMIVPELILSMLGDPGSFFGGRLSLDASIMGLRREGEAQDVTRGVAKGGWRKRTILPLGIVSDTNVLARGDVFNVRDRDIVDVSPLEDDDVTDGRLFAQIHNIFRYPLQRTYGSVKAVIEPITAITLSPDIDQREEEIPNEDSQDVQLDITGLFNENRFPGEDRVEDKSRVTYGLNSGVYFDDGSQARAFIGQSYQFDNQDIIFPEGSGLSQESSDIVGRIGVQYKQAIDLDYSFQFDSASLQAERHEITSNLNIDRFRLNSRYFYSRGLSDTAVDNNREQLRTAAFLWLDEERFWRSRGGFTYDFTENSGLRRAYLGLDFINDCRCWDLSMTAVRNLTSDASGESSTEFLVQIGFKNLGNFGNDALSSD